MKNLITAMASIIILLVFVMQFTTSQITHRNITFAQKEVNEFLQQVRVEGYISNSNSSNLQSRLSNILKCQASEITISGGQIPVYRGEKIQYKITFPLKDLIAAPGILGIDESQARQDYNFSGETTSELIDRSKNW